VKKNITLLTLFVFALSLASFGQGLNITISNPTQDTTICEGDTLILQSTTKFLNNDFNNGTIGVGWSSTAANPVFNNPCGDGPVGIHLWVGATNSATRTIETVSYDLTTGSACFVSFWMRYGRVQGAGPCEDPDLPDEGVHLQYRTNNGPWFDFPGPNLDPIGNLMTVGPGYWTLTPGTGGYWTAIQGQAGQAVSTLYHWNEYRVEIPPTAVSTSTQFRWAQLANSSTNFDAWGIDEVVIGCTPGNVIWTPTGTTTMNDTVSPVQSTEYIVEIFDTLGNSAMDTVMVYVYPQPRLAGDIIGYCGDSTLIVTLDTTVMCNTIDFDGSLIRMLDPNGVGFPVINAVPINCQMGMTNQFLIQTLFPLQNNGTYQLFTKIGNDANTAISECGSLVQFDTVNVTIIDCYDVEMDLLNVTVLNNDHPEIEWSFTTDTNRAHLDTVFEAYYIYRSLNPKGPYSLAGTVNTFLDTVWEDPVLGTLDVNSKNYNYRVDMVFNGGNSSSSDSIQTILLGCGDFGTDTTTLEASWTSYWGWPNPDYILEEKSSAGFWNVIGTTTDTFLVYPKTFDSDDYTIRVKTINPVDTSLVSISNFCTYSVAPRDARVTMPNVFTPGGNYPYFNAITANDSTTNLSEFQGYIYNRWGTKLYEWTDWENMSAGWDGNGHPEGTYYYVVKARGIEGELFEKSGHFMLFRREE